MTNHEDPPRGRGLGRPPAQGRVDNTGATIGTQITADTINLGSLVVTTPAPTPAPEPVTTIALFSANTTSSGHYLRLEEEMSAIGDALRATRFRERYALHLCPAASFDKLIRELDDLQPQVVHMCGHATRDGEIILKRGDSEHHIAPSELAELFRALRQPPRLAVFASCHSWLAAEALVGTVAHAIGFEGELHDETAAAFGRCFYERLGSQAQLDVAHAFRLAKLATLAAGHGDAEGARLFSAHDP